MDYETLLEVATKVEQQVKEEDTKTYDFVERTIKKTAKLEVLNLIYKLAEEVKNG